MFNFSFRLSLSMIIALILFCSGLKLCRYLKKRNKMRLKLFESMKDDAPPYSPYYIENPPSYSQIFRLPSLEFDNSIYNQQTVNINKPKTYEIFFAYPLSQQQDTDSQNELNQQTIPTLMATEAEPMAAKVEMSDKVEMEPKVDTEPKTEITFKIEQDVETENK